MRRFQSIALALLLWAALLGMAACSKSGPATSNDDIRKAIESYLANKPGLSASEIVLEVKKVDVKGDAAETDVVFRSKSNPNATMDFHYRLHNEGGAWKVESPSGNSAHAGAAMPPQGEDPGNTAPQGTTGLPEGHPKVK